MPPAVATVMVLASSSMTASVSGTNGPTTAGAESRVRAGSGTSEI